MQIFAKTLYPSSSVCIMQRDPVISDFFSTILQVKNCVREFPTPVWRTCCEKVDFLCCNLLISPFNQNHPQNILEGNSPPLPPPKFLRPTVVPTLLSSLTKDIVCIIPVTINSTALALHWSLKILYTLKLYVLFFNA